jgi:hypothetical protein
VVAVVLALAFDFAARLRLEGRLEGRLNATEDFDDAVLELHDWPFLWHARDDRFPHARLSGTVRRDRIEYAPLVLEVVSFFHYRDAQCPGNEGIGTGARSGRGSATLREDALASLLQSQGVKGVEISDGRMELHRANGDRVAVDESQLSIQRNDVSGDVVIETDDPLIAYLPEPVDGVKFKDVSLRPGEMFLPFRMIDPELFCI